MLFARINDEDSRYPNGFWWLMIGREDLTEKDLVSGEEYRFENRSGGGYTTKFNREDKSILELCESDSWESLDWDVVLLNPKSKYGYIDPEGKWYGCNYETHSLLAKYVLKLDKPEEHGWVKVYRGFSSHAYYDGNAEYFSKRKFLTEAQIKTLLDRKIEVHEWDCPEELKNYFDKYENHEKEERM